MSDPAVACPKCGSIGTAVDRITLKALLKPDGLRRGIPARPRFCATADCPIVYFDADGEKPFTEADLTVLVFSKHSEDPTALVCYCFGINVETMRDATLARPSRESVGHEVQAGHCACEVKNPKGGCCLGDLVRLVRGHHLEVPASSCCTVS